MKMNLMKSYMITPFHLINMILTNLQNGKKIKDFSDWSKDGKMDKNESKIQLKRWKEDLFK